jgi:hypothetical protein
VSENLGQVRLRQCPIEYGQITLSVFVVFLVISLLLHANIDEGERVAFSLLFDFRICVFLCFWNLRKK